MGGNVERSARTGNCGKIAMRFTASVIPSARARVYADRAVQFLINKRVPAEGEHSSLFYRNVANESRDRI